MGDWWRGRSRGHRFVLGLIGMVLAVNIGLAALGSVIDRNPTGPPSSPRGTGGDGLAAFVDLLRARGHAVTVNRSAPVADDLPVGGTVFLVDPVHVERTDAQAIADFLRGGGRLVAVGPTTAGLLASHSGADTVPDQAQPAERLEVWVPGRLTGSARSLAGDAGTRWRDIGELVPVAGADGRPFAVTGSVDSGRLIGLADSTPLHNRNIARADNAAFGLALAGDGPVTIVDRTAEPGATGLAAVPSGWKWTAAFLAVTATAFLWMAGTRFGPAEPQERELRPARLDHVDAVVAGIARQKPSPALATDRMRRRERHALTTELRIDADTSDAVVRTTATTASIPAERIDAVLTEPRSDADALALGRIAAIRANRGAEQPDEPSPTTRISPAGDEP